MQFSDLSWPYFDHTFASEKPQNDYTPIQMVSNESLWWLSIVFTKKNHLKSMNRASSSFKVQFFIIFSLNSFLFWPHFCFQEASKWLHINANGLKCKFKMSLNGFDQNGHLESINKACRSFKVQFVKFSVLIWPYFGPI